MFEMQTSKRGSSGILITSPRMILSFFSSGVPWTRLVSSAAMRGSISTAVTALAALRIRTVRLPVPGPISRTWSLCLRCACGLLVIAIVNGGRGGGYYFLDDCCGYSWVFQDLDKLSVSCLHLFIAIHTCCPRSLSILKIECAAEAFEVGFAYGELSAAPARAFFPAFGIVGYAKVVK